MERIVAGRHVIFWFFLVLCWQGTGCGGRSNQMGSDAGSDAEPDGSRVDAGLPVIDEADPDASIDASVHDSEIDASQVHQEIDIDAAPASNDGGKEMDEPPHDAETVTAEWCGEIGDADELADVNVRIFLVNEDDGLPRGSERIYYFAVGERAIDAREAECVNDSCSEWVIRESVCGTIAIMSGGYEPAESPYEEYHICGKQRLDADPRIEQIISLEVTRVLVSGL